MHLTVFARPSRNYRASFSTSQLRPTPVAEDAVRTLLHRALAIERLVLRPFAEFHGLCPALFGKSADLLTVRQEELSSGRTSLIDSADDIFAVTSRRSLEFKTVVCPAIRNAEVVRECRQVHSAHPCS